MEADKFVTSLLSALKACVGCVGSEPSKKLPSEKMMGIYHQLRVNDAFLLQWREFSKKSTGDDVRTITFQCITERLFRKVLVSTFPVEQDNDHCSRSQLTYMEENGLRYATGYVPRKLIARLQKSGHPLKENLIECLETLTDTSMEINEDVSEDWMNTVDRGGLIHVTDQTYRFFVAMEVAVRAGIAKHPENFKETVKAGILENEDVQFHWSILSAEWNIEEEKALLPMILDLWVTIRGFSYASAWNEKYKCEQQKSTQKSKGVRKELIYYAILTLVIML